MRIVVHEGLLSVFSAWSNFYVITGSSAASLTGLMFVVVTLIASRGRPINGMSEGFNVFSTPTVVHFCSAFVVSGIVSAPWRTLFSAEVAIGLAGLCGVVYIVRITARILQQTAYKPLLEDWIWFTILPLFAYLAVTASALLLFPLPVTALFVLAAATMMLILIGIHNAWDIVTYLTIDNPDT
jgi:hypothetical protein